MKKIMRYIEGRDDFTANDVNRDLFKNRLDKNEKGSMYRLFQAMVREQYLTECGKREGLKVYSFNASLHVRQEDLVDTETEQHTHDQEDALPGAQPAPAPEPLPAPSPLSPREILLGKLREFVYMKSGSWNHDDWMWLIHRPDIRELNFSESEIGQMLEQEKTHYWVSR